MKDQFVPYELALELKQLGFNEKCFATYWVDGRLSRNPSHDMGDLPIEGQPYDWINSEIHKDNCTAPLWQQAFDWLLPKLPDYNLDQMENTFDLRYYDGKEWGYILMLSTRQACLEKLIEIKKS